MVTARTEEIDRVLGLNMGRMTIFVNHLVRKSWLHVYKAVLRRLERKGRT